MPHLPCLPRTTLPTDAGKGPRTSYPPWAAGIRLRGYASPRRIRTAANPSSTTAYAQNSPSFEDTAVLEFFETSTRNILDVEAAAGVGHHVALSVVGTERLAESGYMRAKIAQEKLIQNSAIPCTIVRATQFFEFAARIADEARDGDTVRVPPVLIQPMAADDVAAAVGTVALDAPLAQPPEFTYVTPGGKMSTPTGDGTSCTNSSSTSGQS